MKFISKQTNYLIVLKPGIGENKITGDAGRRMESVRFENGIANVTNDEWIEKLKNHPRYGYDFVAETEGASDPWAETRRETEPAHTQSEIKHGSVAKSKGTPVPVKFTPIQKEAMSKIVKAEAEKLAKEMVKQVLEEQLASAKKTEEKPEKPVTKKIVSKTKKTTKKTNKSESE